MFKLLILTSTEGGEPDGLREQIDYLTSFGLSVDVLVDPDEIDLIRRTEKAQYDCAYIHIKRRFVSERSGVTYDPVKILEHKNIPLLGNSYITQLMIADKFLTSKKSGIGLPNILVTRETFGKGLVDWNEITGQIGLPIIVKPNSLHASMGISQDSVAFSQNALQGIIENLFDHFSALHEVLLERFAENGTEYTVSVLGNNESLACSVSRLDFKSCCNIHINSDEEKNLPLERRSFAFAIEEDPVIRQRLEFHAKTLFRHFNMKDIARFDMMLDKSYYLLEANTCPIPGNSFSWEWQVKYGAKKKQIVALFLCAFHFGRIAAGKPSRLPRRLIDAQPPEIIDQINHPIAVDVCPECSGPSENCSVPQLFTMNDRVSSESEVHAFLKSLTVLVKPAFVLETGTYKGSATTAFAEGIRINGYGKIVSIEINEQLAQSAKELFSEYPVEIICGNSLCYTPTMPVDLLFLDSKRILRRDEFFRFRPYLHAKTIIVWHDSSYRSQNHAVFDAVNELYKENVIDRILLPTPRGLTLSMLKCDC